MPRFLAKIGDDEYDIELEYHSERYFARVNNSEKQIDLFTLGENRAIMLIDNESLEIDIRSNGYDRCKTVFIKGREIEVEIEDYRLAQLKKTAGMKVDAKSELTIKAPMPGLILDVKVKDGDTVSKDQPLVIIEAMKMENIIKSPSNGVVKSVPVKKGESVDKGDRLVEMA